MTEYDNKFIEGHYQNMPFQFELNHKGKFQKIGALKLNRKFIIWCLVAFALPFLVYQSYQTSGKFQKTEIINGNTVAPSFEKAPAPVEKKYYVFTDFKPKNDTEKRTVEYIRRFHSTAQAESEKFGQPASVKLAQAIHESNAGASKLARENNNHFGIKCFSKKCKKGHCSNYTDDSHKDFFRKYESAWFSFRDHSKKVGAEGRYKSCHGLTPEKWCDCLKKKGYATNKKYPQLLKELIEKYRLKDFD